MTADTKCKKKVAIDEIEVCIYESNNVIVMVLAWVPCS